VVLCGSVAARKLSDSAICRLMGAFPDHNRVKPSPPPPRPRCLNFPESGRRHWPRFETWCSVGQQTLL
jgi:hypothetical protein